jgi:hypothetical protein
MTKRRTVGTTPNPNLPPRQATYAERMRAIKEIKRWITPPEDKAEAERVRLNNEIADLERWFFDQLVAVEKDSPRYVELWAQIDKLRETEPSFNPGNRRDRIEDFDDDDLVDLRGEED